MSGMSSVHACTTPVHRKRLVDPAACGVRLGVELRAAAEQEASRLGMCLSHWIKKAVEEAISRSAVHDGTRRGDEPNLPLRPETKSVGTELDRAYEREMEKLNDR